MGVQARQIGPKAFTMHRNRQPACVKTALAAALLGTTMILAGCSTEGGLFVGALFGAAFGGTTDAVVSGALVGGAIGTIGEAIEADYQRQLYRTSEWYRECDCPTCRARHASY